VCINTSHTTRTGFKWRVPCRARHTHALAHIHTCFLFHTSAHTQASHDAPLFTLVTHTLSLSKTHTHSLFHTHTVFLTHTRQTKSLTRTRRLRIALTFARSSHTHTRSLTFFLSLSLSHTHRLRMARTFWRWCWHVRSAPDFNTTSPLRELPCISKSWKAHQPLRLTNVKIFEGESCI